MPRIANFVSVAFAVCGIVSAIYNFDNTSNELQFEHGTKLNKAYAVVSLPHSVAPEHGTMASAMACFNLLDSHLDVR